MGTTHQDGIPQQQHLSSGGAHCRAGLEAGIAHKCRPDSPGGMGSPAHLSRLHSHPVQYRSGPGAGSGQSCKTSAPPHMLGWHSLEWGRWAGSKCRQREVPEKPPIPEGPEYPCPQVIAAGNRSRSLESCPWTHGSVTHTRTDLPLSHCHTRAKTLPFFI